MTRVTRAFLQEIFLLSQTERDWILYANTFVPPLPFISNINSRLDAYLFNATQDSGITVAARYSTETHLSHSTSIEEPKYVVSPEPPSTSISTITSLYDMTPLQQNNFDLEAMLDI